jgi:site-specific recombinase XerD
MTEGLRYPEDQSPFRAELPERDRRFAELREEYLLNYGYNTARAYWGDLDDLLLWAVERDKDVLSLTSEDIKRYLTRMKRRKYSPNTIRRRRTAFRGFYGLAVAEGDVHELPAVLR